ncbi:MAG: hypothetical protein KBC33_02155 [Candidatus Pacebacteria bacterium]|nr:hypothetical protein [Candidatus Paceibacterota bacterium]
MNANPAPIRPEDEVPQTESPTLSPFGHPLTITTFFGSIGLVLLGLFLAFGEYWLIGIALATIGAAVFIFGRVYHSPSKPLEGGIVSFMDAPLKIGGKYITVGGTPILAPYLRLSSIKVNMETVNSEFTMTVISNQDPDGKRNMPLTGKVKVTWHPNPNDLIDYNQVGNDPKKVEEILNDHVFPETQRIIKEGKISPIDICQNGPLISDELNKSIRNGLFNRKRLGIVLEHVKVEFPLPNEIREEMVGVNKEQYQREAERQEYETVRIAALEMQQAAAIQQIPNAASLNQSTLNGMIGELVRSKVVNDLNWYIEQVRSLRLVKDGMVARIEGGNGTVNLASVDVQFGAKNKQKGGR